MSKRKIQISKSQIMNTIVENVGKFKKTELMKVIQENEDKFQPEKTPGSELEGMTGAEQDRKIEYPDAETMGALGAGSETDKPSEFTGGVDTPDGPGLAAKMSKSAPSQLIEYLEKLEEAKSVLSKVAAGETDQEVKSKIYSHYEKVQKTAFEMIKEFGIVH
jgi:hypothetical protein